MGSFTMPWTCSTMASMCAAYLQSVQEAGEAQVLAPDLQRKCNALRAIQEKVQAAKQHKELKVHTHCLSLKLSCGREAPHSRCCFFHKQRGL